MKLERLEITKFLGLDSAVLEPSAPVVLVCGQNGSGKSSIHDALEFAISGTLPSRRVTTKKGAAALARAKGCKVAVTLGGLEWERTPKECSIPEGTLAGGLGSPEMALALVNASKFIDLDPKARRELVRQVTCKPEVIRDAVVKLAAGAGLESAAEIIAETAASDLDGAEKYAVDMRVRAKRELAELPSPPPAKFVIGEKEFDLSEFDEAGCVEALAEVQSERDALMQDYGVAKLANAPEEIEKRIKEIEAEIFTLSASGTEGEEAATTPKDVADALRKAHAAEASVVAKRESYVKAQAAKEAATKAFKAAEKLKGKCPTCRTKLDDDAVAKLLAELVEDGDKAAALMETLAAEGKEAKAKAEAARAAHTKADKDHARFNELQITLAGEREALAKSKDFDAINDAINEKMRVLTASVEIGRAVLDEKRRYDGVLAQLARSESIQAEIDAWDKVATGLGAKGEIRRLAASGLDLEAVRAHVNALFGQEIALEVTPEWEVMAGGRLAELWSESERYRFGAAFAAALAAASELRFLVLDRADIFDSDNRSRLLAWLESLASSFDTVLVLATAEKPPEPAAWLDVWALKGEKLARAEFAQGKDEAATA